MINSWSFSRYQTFQECPYRAKLAWVDKIPDEQPKVAADRGTAIHTLAEDFVRDDLTELPAELAKYSDEFSALKRLYSEGKVSLEGEWGFTENWEPTDYSTAWLRVKLDAAAFMNKTHAAVIDHKTGKRFGNELKHGMQLQLYALTTLLRHPDLQKVTAELWYLDKDDYAFMTMTRRQLSRNLAYWDREGKRITTETQFKPRPNIVTCKWCPYHPAKQGDCKYGV